MRGPALAMEDGLPPRPSPGPGRPPARPVTMPALFPTGLLAVFPAGRLAWRLGDLVQGVAVRRRQRALETMLDGMAERVAVTELALLRQQNHAHRQQARAEAAEAALVRLQDMLDQLRQERHQGRPQG